jgi:hypothetical protein
VNGTDLALRALHRAECRLADDLVALADRHRAEHEVHHVATDLARWSREHARRLAGAAGSEGPPGDPADRLFAPVAASGPQETDRHPAPGLVLLRDLRDVHLAATETSLHWEMLAQAAQASRNAALLELASSCHPRTLRQMRWTNTMIRTLSPQVLTSL